MYKEIKCARCGNILEFIKISPLQLGRDKGFFSDSQQWAKGFLNCDIYFCSECGEFHFFKHEDCPKEDLVKCKWCLNLVDPSYPHCPECGHKEGDKW